MEIGTKNGVIIMCIMYNRVRYDFDEIVGASLTAPATNLLHIQYICRWNVSYA